MARLSHGVQKASLAAGGITMLCVAASGIQAQAAQRQNLPVNLGSGAVVGVLPFDEPFLLSGGAGDRFVSIDVWYAGEKNLPSSRCTSAFADSLAKNELMLARYKELESQISKKSDPADIKKVDDLRTQLVVPFPDSAPLKYAHAKWRQQVRIPADSFRLLVGPIRANTDYTFCYRVIKRPSVEDSTLFRSNAVVMLTKYVRESFAGAPKAIETVANIRDMQRDLLATLPQGDSLVPAKNSLLDINAPVGGLLPRISSISAIDSRRDQDVTSINTTMLTARPSLAAMAQNGPALDALLATIDANASKSPGAEWVPLRPTVQALIGWVQNNNFLNGWTSSVATGSSRIDQRQDLKTPYNKMWLSDSIAAHLQMIDSTRSLLLALSDYARFLQKQPTSLPAAVTGKQLKQTLQQLDKLARDAMDARSQLSPQRNNLIDLRDALMPMPALVEALASSVTTLDLAVVQMIGTTTAEYVSRSKAYISADFGLLYGTGVREVAPYAGVNFYSISVNKGAPLSRCEWTFQECLRKRLSLTLGLTVADISKTGKTESLFSGKMALVGLGVRVTDYIRATAGGLIFQTLSEDAKRTRQITMKPAFSLSVDVDIKATLGKFGEWISP